MLNVSPRRKPNSSYIADLQVIDASMVPTTISLWDQFQGPFPDAIGLPTYSTIYSNPSRCLANAEKINNLPPPTPANLQRAVQKQPTADDIITIFNLPTSVTVPEYPSVQGIIKVLVFNQNFYYLSCSNCNRAINAYGDGSFWYNYCDQKVPPLPRIKFNAQITDATGFIPATIFVEKAKELYNITAAEMVNNTIDDNLSVHMIQSYGLISQCVLSVHSIFNSIPDQQALEEASVQNLGPNTPKKRGTKAVCTAESPTNDDAMEQDGTVGPLKNKQKKE